jgi:hypothetical protein
MSPFRASPLVDDRRFGWLRPWPGRQIIRFFFNGSRQEPKILFVSFFIPLDCGEGVVEIIT